MNGGVKYLTPHEVVDRYQKQISTRTLANWRSQGIGPPFSKIGGRILYRLDLVEQWEQKRTVNGTNQYRP